MSFQSAILTICGGFIFPFVIKMFLGKMVRKLGAIGGWISALTIVGTAWIIEHGMRFRLIQQTGLVWIDMAWAVAIGLFTASVVNGGKARKSIVNVLATLICG